MSAIEVVIQISRVAGGRSEHEEARDLDDENREGRLTNAASWQNDKVRNRAAEVPTRNARIGGR